MATLHKEVDRYDYKALLELLEAVTGISSDKIVKGSLAVTQPDPTLNDLPVIRFETIVAPNRDNTKSVRLIEIRPGAEFEDQS